MVEGAGHGDENPRTGTLIALYLMLIALYLVRRRPHPREYVDDPTHGRLFSPAYYASVFRDLGVSDVVRLNAPRYSARDWADAGFRPHHLAFPDCTAPPPSVVEAFLRAADAAPGVVAVHCKAGLGRTGTLIALYLMRRRGFSAREAMGWLRVARPGSVIGEQQHFLCAVEAGCETAGLVEEDEGCSERRAEAERRAEEVSKALHRRAGARPTAKAAVGLADE